MGVLKETINPIFPLDVEWELYPPNMSSTCHGYFTGQPSINGIFGTTMISNQPYEIWGVSESGWNP